LIAGPVGARYIIGNDSHVEVTDRGLAYGDGLFETMAVRDGRVARLEFHFERLELGCRRLSLPIIARNALEPEIARALQGIESGTLKLLLTRGTGPRGYAPPESPHPTVILLPARTPVQPPAAISVASLGTRLGENEKLAGIKHLNRLEQVLGQLELAGRNADEGLMLSQSGFVIGGTSRNLFARFGERLVTPKVDRAGIAGVMRRSVIEQCRRLEIDLEETNLTPGNLADADEIFMTNALAGIQTVVSLDGRRLESSAMASTLRTSISRLETGDDA